MNIRTNDFKSESGFLLFIVAVVVIIIIVAAVLFATGVIKTPEATRGGGNCEILYKHCEASCDNNTNCKNSCLNIYQQCKSEEEK